MTNHQSDKTREPQGRVSRRQFIRRAACAGLGVGCACALQSGCAPTRQEPPAGQPQLTPTPAESEPASTAVPTPDGAWTLSAPETGRLPTGTGSIQIKDIAKFSFDAGQVKAVRTDIFQPGHFSMFDILVHLADRGDIRMNYHFDEQVDTHVIDEINGQGGWWYDAYYSAGWRESNVFRMDMYPYKNETQLRVYKEREQQLANIYRTLREEVERLTRNEGQIILPKLTIRGPNVNHDFQDIVVTPHNVRSDVLQPGVTTALDALLSLGEQGKLSEIELTWYGWIGPADPVDSYWVSQIDEDIAYGGCGFVYETGPRDFAGFAGTHIHLPSDVRVTVSPEYALWFWICLGMGGF